MFPGAERNSVRNKIHRLLSVSEAYALRLEKAWTELWIAHRGTGELPDEDPNNLKEFDILAHIAFLRRHVDKNALYVHSSIQMEAYLTHNLYSQPSRADE